MPSPSTPSPAWEQPTADELLIASWIRNWAAMFHATVTLDQCAQSARDLLLAARAADVSQIEIAKDATEVCICGCPIVDHENYGEDGEQCEHEDHECFRTSKAAYAVVHALRAQVEQLTQEKKKQQRVHNEEVATWRDDVLRLENQLKRLADSSRGLLDFIRQQFPDDFKEGGRGFTCQHHRNIADALAQLRQQAAEKEKAKPALEYAADVLTIIARRVPVGDEDRTRGCSTYNWLTYAASLLRIESAKERAEKQQEQQ